MPKESLKHTFTRESLKKIGKGALIALGGALLTYLTEIITNIDFQEWTPIVVAGWAILVNTIRKYLQNE